MSRFSTARPRANSLARRTKDGYTALTFGCNEEAMRLKLFAAAVAAISASTFVFPADPAGAATKRKPVVVQGAGTGTVVRMTDESGRTRTKIIIQKRSFLDAGTEVLPGERKFTDYVYPLGYSVTGVIDNTSRWQRFPLPGPFDLPSRWNPYPWGY
jgi:hypothetical protein